ncbi:MAG: nickel/cobalt transporter (NiCoT) family protein, partial [Mycobacterium sp.]|nr:nickel/cobalt transporter (NiCoT) family protein [Mycobacterium sp.]
MAADTVSRHGSSRTSRLRGALTPDEWLRLGSMFAIIVALHVIGWGTLILIVEPAHLSIGDKAFGIGIGLTAYT